MTPGIPTGGTGRTVAHFSEWRKWKGRRKGTGLREIRSAVGACRVFEGRVLGLLYIPEHSALSWPTAGAEGMRTQVYLTDGGAALVPVDADLPRGSSLD